MVTFPIEYWIVLGLIGLGAVLSMLGRLAAAVEDEQRLHDARVGAERMRRQYAAQAAAQEAEHEIIEVDEAPQQPAKAA